MEQVPFLKIEESTIMMKRKRYFPKQGAEIEIILFLVQGSATIQFLLNIIFKKI